MNEKLINKLSTEKQDLWRQIQRHMNEVKNSFTLTCSNCSETFKPTTLEVNGEIICTLSIVYGFTEEQAVITCPYCKTMDYGDWIKDGKSQWR